MVGLSVVRTVGAIVAAVLTGQITWLKRMSRGTATSRFWSESVGRFVTRRGRRSRKP